MTSRENQAWVDYVRVFATFCVVLLHSAAPLLYKYNELPAMSWWTGNVYDSVVRVCVPLFFMISGYLLLEKKETLGAFFQKRIQKVAVPLLAWSILYVLWSSYFLPGQQLSIHSFYSIIISPAYYHLWFLYAIIGIYICMPFLRVIVIGSDRRLLSYYVLLWFFAVSVIPILEYLMGLDSRIDLLSISGFSGYLVLGLLLGKCHVSSRLAAASAVIFLASAGLTAVGTYFLTVENDGRFSGYFYEYLSPNVIVMSAAVLVVLRFAVEGCGFFHNPRVLVVVRSLSAASLGIYLVHAILLHVLGVGSLGFVFSGFVGDPIYSIPGTAVVVFLLSYLVTIAMKRIPLVKKIVP